MDKLKDAVIIHGPGRSGTTLLNNILALHESFYWISSYVNKYPNIPILSIFNSLQRNNYIRKFSKSPKPTEPYNFFINHLEGFNKEHAKPKQSEINGALNAIKQVQCFSSGNRFITKLTGSARYNYIEALFDNPTILWIDRQPEAVVMSYYKQKWGYKNKLSVFNETPKQELINKYVNRFETLQKEKHTLKKFNFKQLYYEDLITNPITFFEELSSNIGLAESKSFEAILKNWPVYKGSNSSWKKMLNKEEQDALSLRLSPISRELGYPIN